MDYFQGVVVDYLRADRAVFVNTECCIQINPGENPDTSGPHWYCDAVALDLHKERVFLCEISYAKDLTALFTRLKQWDEHWPGVCRALERDCHLRFGWPITPWLFIPEQRENGIKERIQRLGNLQKIIDITRLEDVLPWKYKLWSRVQAPDQLPR